MNCRLLTSIALAAFGSSYSTCLLAQQPHKYAFIVGIGDYPAGVGLAKLKADDDTDSLASHLKKSGWNVYLMNRHADTPQQPNRANILRALGVEEKADGTYEYVQSTSVSFLGDHTLNASDTLLFYYGGHGTRLTDGTNYIIPKDVQNASARGQLISLSVIREALDLTNAGNVIVLTDACRTRIDRGPVSSVRVWRGATVSAASGRVLDLDFPQRHFYTMSASQVGAPSYEKDDAGLFTYFLNSAFDNPANAKSNPVGCVTLRELGQYTSEQTQIYARTKLNTTQVPTLESDGSGWEDHFCMIPFEGNQGDDQTTASTRTLPAAKPTIESFEASAETVTAGQSVTLKWSVTDAIRVVISNVGAVPASGSKRVSPTEDTSYVLVATGSGGSSSQKVDVTVESLECEVKRTGTPWYPPGEADVTIDGDDVGTFKYGPYGSSSFTFDCTPGQHNWHFGITDAAGTQGYCDGVINITPNTHRFVPAVRADGYGHLQCALMPN